MGGELGVGFPHHVRLQVAQPLPNPAWTCPSPGSPRCRASLGSCPATDGTEAQLVRPQRGAQGEVTELTCAPKLSRTFPLGFNPSA